MAARRAAAAAVATPAGRQARAVVVVVVVVASGRVVSVRRVARKELLENAVVCAELEQCGDVDDAEHEPLAVAKRGRRGAACLGLSLTERDPLVGPLAERPALLLQSLEEALHGGPKVVERDLGEEHAVEVDEELGLRDVGLGAARLVLVLKEREDRLARREIRVCGGQTVGEGKSSASGQHALGPTRRREERTHLFE